jgi:D-3-phosphoglycerate dehydrogenase / 2-oxoglutarate reductase
VPPADAGAELVSMDRLLARSDVISVHARLTPENGRMFAREEFGRMRPGAYFINTAREGLVDENALCEALERGHLRGAALDVLERTPGRHPLLGLPNVFVTPHIGGATAETLARGAQRAVAAVTDLLAGRVPAHVVNPQVLRGTR